MIKIFVCSLISGFILSGCSAATVADFRYTPTAVICQKLLTTPSYNRNRRAREQALYERGEDCSNVQVENLILTYE